MDFIIIYPPSHKRPTGVEAYSTKKDPLALPMGGLFLAEALLRIGCKVAILHGELEEILEGIDNLTSVNTIALGISTVSGGMLEKAIEIAKYVREKHPDKPIIWGGAHPTAQRIQTLQSDLVDFVVWGEGEQSLPHLLDAISTNGDFSKIKGIGYKINHDVYLTENMGYTPLDRVFELPYHLLDMNRYARKMLIGGNRWFGVMSARGCPFRCKFCSNSSIEWPNTRIRYHIYDHIVNNITVLVEKYGADAIGFEDEVSCFNETRLRELCHIMRNLPGNLTYRIISRADKLSELSLDSFKLLRDAGVVSIAFGPESGSQRILDFIGKGITLKQIHESDKRLTDFDFYKSYSFMTAIPTETIPEMKMTLQLLVALARNSKRTPFPFRRLLPYIPLPGTELYHIAQDNGFIPPGSIEGWTKLDYLDVIGRRERIRPWLTEEMARWVVQAMEKVARVSTHFTGKNADLTVINMLLDELEHFAQ